MRHPSPSVVAAKLIRFAFRWPLVLQMALNRRVLALTFWLEDERALDHPLPWLAGLILTVLLIWLVRDVRA